MSTKISTFHWLDKSFSVSFVAMKELTSETCFLDGVGHTLEDCFGVQRRVECTTPKCHLYYSEMYLFNGTNINNNREMTKSTKIHTNCVGFVRDLNWINSQMLFILQLFFITSFFHSINKNWTKKRIEAIDCWLQIISFHSITFHVHLMCLHFISIYVFFYCSVCLLLYLSVLVLFLFYLYLCVSGFLLIADFPRCLSLSLSLFLCDYPKIY